MNTKTNKNGAVVFAMLVSGVAAVALAGPANAHSMKKMAAPAATEPASPLDQAIRTTKGNDFSIISEQQLRNADAAFIQETTSDAKLKAIQASILANPSLDHKITAQNVEVKEITGATRAADGGLIFYTM